MNSSRLRPGNFAEYFEAVHHVEPFPWQQRLAQEVCEKGEWPNALDIPTGAGKTAAIDIAVFHLALEADRGLRRRAAVRIAFVVDRRLVVDDAYQRSLAIARAVGQATEGILVRVRESLTLLAESSARPLAVARLRGGLAREPDWVRTPSQPVVVLSTVDQVGSRLLFRGYGVSDRMKPVHAGLLGTDALLLLDEAHLSQPFVQTVAAIRKYSAFPKNGEMSMPGRPVEAVTLSATQNASHPFRISPEDFGHPALGRRLRASKPVEILHVKVLSDEPAFAQAFAAHGLRLSRLGEGTATVVGIVVNRVGRARQVFDALRRSIDDSGKSTAADVALLLGRTRPLDREEVLRDLLPRMRAGRSSPGERPLFVVATQCIEVGADLDFDALITEVAPLDCLRQRFGRLNRMGREIDARGIVLASTDQTSSFADDVLYRKAPLATWKLLQKHSVKIGKGKGQRVGIDFGIEASRVWLPNGADLECCLAPRQDAPVVLSPYIDFWTKTSPLPVVSPEPAIFLHGPESGPPEVTIVWRADLSDRAEDEAHWKDKVAACSPSTLESISVPFSEALRWLRGKARADIADVESPREVESGDEVSRRFARVLRWRGEETSDPVGPEQIRPEDVLVVPATRGGLDEWGWNPASERIVDDRAREASRAHRGHDVLRLAPALLEYETVRSDQGPARVTRAVLKLESLLSESRELSEKDILIRLEAADWLPADWRGFLNAYPHLELLRMRDGTALVLRTRVSPQPEGIAEVASLGSAVTEEDDISFRARRRVKLMDHSRGVAAIALSFAEQIGLPEGLRDDIVLAALLHDAGKAHPAMKEYLYGGDPLAAIAGPPLAKSGLAHPRTSARLPSRARHEAASIRFAVAHPRFSSATDKNLVLWLIGTHHGFGRPFFPAVEWPPRGESFELDIGEGAVQSSGAPQVEDPGDGWPDLFVKMKHEYGAWRLAWLESIVRLADHRQSEREQSEEGVGGAT